MKRIPIGIENFKEMIDTKSYYIDKTQLISNIIDEKVVLFTRPRRFGKTLNMNMLYYFFSDKEKENAYLFDGLKVSQDKKALEHQNQYPVLFLTLKDMSFSTMDQQIFLFNCLISQIMDQYSELLESDVISQKEINRLLKFYDEEADVNELGMSLYYISKCIYKVYKKKVILLIDEYDVPLQAAYKYGYYDEMVNFLRTVFSSSLKTNEALQKGILTGCLRIARESIFTGMNNFNVYSLMDSYCSDCFGFKEEEIKKMLEDYELSCCFDEVREWYDGYRFGKTEIYNPWSTLKYVLTKKQDFDSLPTSFWANSSSNDIVVQYIQADDGNLHEDFEKLIHHECIEKTIKEELTYREMDDIQNIYSFLLFTGYLKVVGRNGDLYQLQIPNKEVLEIYIKSFDSYFINYKNQRIHPLLQALKNGNELQAISLMNDLLMRSISYYDNSESFYHGFLIGIFNNQKVKSNQESGNGRFDVCIYPNTVLDKAIVLECKHSKCAANLFDDAQSAVNQMKEKKYREGIQAQGYRNCIGYGISFFKKECIIKLCE
ncbi:AAA family ATPase [Floccifex sp.]|uniref:AAA family ATPase n=1 Tax=Floccifex sp. TaxID=2815810 RepID=UPI003F0C3949